MDGQVEYFQLFTITNSAVTSNLVCLLLCTSVSTLTGSLLRSGISASSGTYICGFDRCCWGWISALSLISCRALAQVYEPQLPWEDIQHPSCRLVGGLEVMSMYDPEGCQVLGKHTACGSRYDYRLLRSRKPPGIMNVRTLQSLFPLSFNTQPILWASPAPCWAETSQA